MMFAATMAKEPRAVVLGRDLAPLDAPHRDGDALEVVEHHQVLAIVVVDPDDLPEAAELGARAVVVLEVDGHLAGAGERMLLRAHLDEGAVGNGGRLDRRHGIDERVARARRPPGGHDIPEVPRRVAAGVCLMQEGLGPVRVSVHVRQPNAPTPRCCVSHIGVLTMCRSGYPEWLAPWKHPDGS